MKYYLMTCNKQRFADSSTPWFQHELYGGTIPGYLAVLKKRGREDVQRQLGSLIYIFINATELTADEYNRIADEGLL